MRQAIEISFGVAMFASVIGFNAARIGARALKARVTR